MFSARRNLQMFPQWWTYSALFRILKILVRLFVLLQFEIFLYFVFCSLFFWWLHFNDIQCSFNFENNDCNSKKKLLLADFDKKHQLQCCDTYFIIISLCAISLSMLHVHISYFVLYDWMQSYSKSCVLYILWPLQRC